MMREMMEKCCGEDGRPDFEKMKSFMENCGKKGFTDDEIKMMQKFCGQAGTPDAEMMKQFMEKFGC